MNTVSNTVSSTVSSTESRDIDTLLSQRPPFRFVDQLVAAGENDAELTLRLAPGDARLDTTGMLRPLLLLEALAQGAAAFHGARAVRRGAPRSERGLLVSIDAARLHGTAAAGDCVRLRVRRERQFGSLVRFTATAAVDDVVLAEATLTVHRDEGIDA